jgi:hypothetical protein
MKSVLAIDGGGLRGLISLGFLARVEALAGTPLSDRFDLVGGTSGGALISTALALGLSVEEIRGFYTDLAPNVFRRSPWRLPGLHALFDEAPLERHIAAICGARRLDSPDLRTGLALLLKRLDTDTIWIVSNNPDAPYWADPPSGEWIGNRHYRLADLVRAATAAPHYFDPEPIPVGGDGPGVFIDAGVTPYNTPCLGLLKLVTIPAYGYGWATGADRLRIVSVGTGTFRNRQPAKTLTAMSSAPLALGALRASIRHGGQMTVALMQMLGETRTRWPLNPEIGHVDDFVLGPAPLFEFWRFDVRLERPWLARELGLDLSDRVVRRLRRMDDPDGLELWWEIGRRAGEKAIDASLFDRDEANTGG